MQIADPNPAYSGFAQRVAVEQSSSLAAVGGVSCRPSRLFCYRAFGHRVSVGGIMGPKSRAIKNDTGKNFTSPGIGRHLGVHPRVSLGGRGASIGPAATVASAPK
jgi:hypothetical protein